MENGKRWKSVKMPKTNQKKSEKIGNKNYWQNRKKKIEEIIEKYLNNKRNRTLSKQSENYERQIEKKITKWKRSKNDKCKKIIIWNQEKKGKFLKSHKATTHTLTHAVTPTQNQNKYENNSQINH